MGESMQECKESEQPRCQGDAVLTDAGHAASAANEKSSY